MNQSNPFIRKIVYIAIIGALLIPLSLVSRPETRNSDGNIQDAGGKLSILRDQHELSQARLSEIDPASETMKLASLGLRGVAVSTLWMQAMEHKKMEEYDQLASTLKALTKIQPNFVKVWEFQAHNLAYNVSMEFDDYEYRYHWVKKGIGFLKDGVPYNKTDHRMTDNLGFFTGNKMGKSDEKDSFRRLFREDNDFHNEMADFIEPQSYETRDHGPDSWKMAYEWYDYSRRLVDSGNGRKRSGDMLFYMYRPAQLRNQGLSLQNEFKTDDVIQEIWRSAKDEWIAYGEEPLTNTLNVTYTMEGMARNEKLLEKFRVQLDELVPGVRQEIVEEINAEANLPDDAMAAWKLPFDQRTDEELALARGVNQALAGLASDLDAKIGLQAKPEVQAKARRIVLEIEQIQREMRTIDKDSGTVNYRFWRSRTDAESSNIGWRARQALFDAEEMRRRSIYDDEFDRDYKTKEITITKRGAISLYLDAFAKWHEVLEQYPELKSGPMSDDLAKSMKQFQQMLQTTNREWPEEFPLQDLIDFRSSESRDGLPTSDELEEMRSALRDDFIDSVVDSVTKSNENDDEKDDESSSVIEQATDDEQ